MDNLGDMSWHGTGTQRDASEAMEWWRKAAAAGSTMAMLNIGAAYLRGAGVPKNLAKAKAWFEKAAAAGDPRGKQALQELQELVPATTRK